MLGSGHTPSTVEPISQTRASSQYFMEAAINSTTIQIYTHTMALRILFAPNKTANAVAVQSGADPQYVISANQEVNLSTGAFRSPQMLMVSGVGPRQIMEEHGIEIVSELPGVGQNLWDSPLFVTLVCKLTYLLLRCLLTIPPLRHKLGQSTS